MHKVYDIGIGYDSEKVINKLIAKINKNARAIVRVSGGSWRLDSDAEFLTIWFSKPDDQEEFIFAFADDHFKWLCRHGFM